MFRSTITRSLAATSCSLSLFYKGYCDTAKPKVGSKSVQSGEEKQLVAVYLKEESKALLQSFLKKKSIECTTIDHACLNSQTGPNDLYVFKPLFGERVAFRLKGLIYLEDGSIIGYGRLSTMIGEIRDDVKLPSMIINLGANEKEVDRESLLNIPTRLFQSNPEIFNKPQWLGRIPAGSIDGKQYPAMKARMIRLPSDQQLVVDGYLCSEHCYDQTQRICTYDRSEEIELQDSPVLNKPTAKQPAAAASSEDDDADECPVCRYMKKGPCRSEFIAWDACVKSILDSDQLQTCFPVTKTMMLCMQQYDYYDIMTAGTDYTRLMANGPPPPSLSSSAGDHSPTDSNNRNSSSNNSG